MRKFSRGHIFANWLLPIFSRSYIFENLSREYFVSLRYMLKALFYENQKIKIKNGRSQWPEKVTFDRSYKVFERTLTDDRRLFWALTSFQTNCVHIYPKLLNFHESCMLCLFCLVLEKNFDVSTFCTSKWTFIFFTVLKFFLKCTSYFYFS